MKHAWITLPDGVRLAADLFMPTGGADGVRFPVLLEYLPYRKDESRQRNHELYSYFVERGYVVARVDIRGTGESEGHVIPYEYSDIELNDGEDVIAWLAAQPWSTGQVGMFGISWGGFNSIQLAVRHPPALKAFIALMATEDLYQDDVHYMDGIMHMDSWMMSQDLYNALPGAPDFVLDDDWYRNRFDVQPSVFTYMHQQRDGPFWDRASARDKLDQLKVPGFLIGGWYDGYRDSVPRIMAGAAAPMKGMVGPWDHYFPHDAWPGPPMEWRNEAVRWFDYWLRGRDTGILDEPRLAVYVRNWHPPDAGIPAVPGHWRWEAGWPLQRLRPEEWYPQADHSLAREAPAPATHQLVYKPSIGVEGGGPVMWWGGIAPDQQPTDDYSLVYDSAPLDREVEILGLPMAHLLVSADAPRANWIARLSDVAPDGQVTLVTGAAFNGTQRISAREPRDLVPGQAFPLDIEMHFTSWVFPKGHRIRLAVNNAQWPMLWPTPYPMTTTLALGAQASRLTLPVAPPGPSAAPHFLEPVSYPPLEGFHTLDAGNVTGYGEIRQVQRDPDTGKAYAVARNSGGYQYPWGVERFEELIEHRTSDVDPAHTSVQGTYAIQEELPERTLRMEGSIGFRSDLENFYLTFTRRLKVNGEVVHEKTWQDTIPRDHQ